MSLRFIVAVMLAYAGLSVFCVVMAWAFITTLNPTLPIIPIGFAILALACAVNFGILWAELSEREKS